MMMNDDNIIDSEIRDAATTLGEMLKRHCCRHGGGDDGDTSTPPPTTTTTTATMVVVVQHALRHVVRDLPGVEVQVTTAATTGPLLGKPPEPDVRQRQSQSLGHCQSNGDEQGQDQDRGDEQGHDDDDDDDDDDSNERREASELVEATVGAQRAVALFRTEARLYGDQALRSQKLLPKLRKAALFLREHYNHGGSDGGSGHTGSSSSGDSTADVRGEDEEEYVQTFLRPYELELDLQRSLEAKAYEMEQLKIDEFVWLRRLAHSKVAKLMTQEQKQYLAVFQQALCQPFGEEAEKQIYKIIERWNNKIQNKGQGKGGQEMKQPVPPPSALASASSTVINEYTTTPEYLQWIKSQAVKTLQSQSSSSSSSVFLQVIHTIAEQCHGHATVAPLKSHSRIVQKTQDKYHGDYSRVTDYVRAMIVFDTLGDLATALTVLDDEDRDEKRMIRVVRAKDRMSTRYDTSIGGGGYRDVLLNLEVPVPAVVENEEDAGSSGTGRDVRMVVELQLHLHSMLEIKDNRGHLNYEAGRSVHMFNSVFSTRRFLWVKNKTGGVGEGEGEGEGDTSSTSEDDVRELLDDVRSGVVTNLDLDYSSALWDDEGSAQDRLAEAFQDPRCALREISLRSCRCGDNFINKCINKQYLEGLPDDLLPPICSVIRLGSKIHQGTAGVISREGVTVLLKFFNHCIRELDFEGCLDENLMEACGDDVISAVVSHVETSSTSDGDIMKNNNNVHSNGPPLPNFRLLNIRSTGLTMDGYEKIQTILGTKLPHLKVLHDDEIRLSNNQPPRRVFKNEF